MMEKSLNDAGEEISEEQAESIVSNLQEIRRRIAEAAVRSGRKPEDITLVAVTKTKPASFASTAIRAGVTIIGENRVQELVEKLPRIELKGAQAHLIGHLQTNKVRQVIDKVAMIQSLDSIHLAKEIDRQAKNIGRVMDVLIEVNIGSEPSKSGLRPEEVVDFAAKLSEYPGLKLRGLMSVPPISEDKDALRPYFRQMRKLFIDIKEKRSDNKDINILSMGMSSDFETAIEEGSNMVRVGSAIFGKRESRRQ